MLKIQRSQKAFIHQIYETGDKTEESRYRQTGPPTLQQALKTKGLTLKMEREVESAQAADENDSRSSNVIQYIVIGKVGRHDSCDYN